MSSALRGAQLATAGGDVDAAPLADGGGEAGVLKHALEGVDGLGGRGQAGVVFRGIERDEVDLRGDSAQQLSQAAGLIGRIVLSCDQRPLEKDPAAEPGCSMF